MKTEYIVFGIIGIVVLYILSKLRSPEPQRVAEFVGSPTAQASPDVNLATQARASAFQALTQVAGAQTQANLARYQTDASLKATQIAADTSERTRSAELASQERISESGFSLQRYLAELQQALGLKGLDVQQATTQAGYQYQENLYAQDLANRLALMQLQTGAIQNAAQTYRNQSLERQGTILNALTSLYGVGAPYSYQSAFGGPRPPGFFSPGGGFSNILGSVGGFLGGLF